MSVTNKVKQANGKGSLWGRYFVRQGAQERQRQRRGKRASQARVLADGTANGKAWGWKELVLSEAARRPQSQHSVSRGGVWVTSCPVPSALGPRQDRMSEPMQDKSDPGQE